MSVNFKMLLGGILTGSQNTRNRHLKEAERMLAAIEQRWGLKHPTQWRLKHVHWFLQEHLKTASSETRYRYWLTTRILVQQLNKTDDWLPRLKGAWTQKDRSNQT